MGNIEESGQETAEPEEKNGGGGGIDLGNVPAGVVLVGYLVLLHVSRVLFYLSF
jgi:hypothetical protein